MVDINVFCAQVKGISSEVIQLVYVNPVDFVAYYLKLPVSSPVRLSSDESSYPLDILRFILKVLIQAFLLYQMSEKYFACYLMLPFDCFFLSFVSLDRNFFYNVAIKSMAIRAMTYVMEKACNGKCFFS